MSNSSWICCQLGAREHYAIPRALHQAGQLSLLLTDAWVNPRSSLGSIPNPVLKGLQERFHPDLATAPVHGFTPSLMQFELVHRLRRTQSWDRMIARNQWFQAQALCHLKKTVSRLSGVQPVLFTYSYAALNLLRYAKSQGWYTVLGQIDPGIVEEKIVLEEYSKYPTLAPDWRPTPPSYWESWKSECDLADCIVVNSNWSKQLLEQAGIESHKIQIVPLVYEPPAEAANFTRTYPDAFSADRPLRVLFLGLVTLRKGIAPLLDAIRLLEGKPIEFWMVGAQQIVIPPEFQNHPQIRWIGSVPRSETAQYYQSADVFLFPTLSDGFGLTQLEAQAWKLPIVASQFCGDVVTDGVNGSRLSEVSGLAIGDRLLHLLKHPTQLTFFSEHSVNNSHFNLSTLSQKLQTLSSAHENPLK
jgi:glycosyltransferase involved in cell wall biosynthesis